MYAIKYVREQARQLELAAWFAIFRSFTKTNKTEIEETDKSERERYYKCTFSAYMNMTARRTHLVSTYYLNEDCFLELG